MKRVPKQKYTMEFKLEAVRLVNSGVRPAEAARQLVVNENTLWNWCKAERTGKLVAEAGPKVTSEQMELSRLRAEVARQKMEIEILKKAAAYFAKESL